MYEKETDFCGCRRIDGCRGCDCLYGKLPTGSFDLLNANIEALAQDESLDPGEGRDFIYCIYNPNYGGPGIFVCSGNNECRFEYNLTWPTKSQTGICYQ